jgi:peptidoglycan/LPS O-acetylase OafA/YrhL
MKLNYIDFLRGIAVLLVILVHTSQSIEGLSQPLANLAGYGQMGVQLFFLVSAYTLCLSAEKRKEEKSKNINYFIRRFFRIAPLYYFAIAFYMIRSCLQNFMESGYFIPSEQYSLPNLFANLLFIHGFYPPANNNIVPGGWSIGTEMMFYVFFPIIFNILNKVKGKNIWLVIMMPMLALIINISFQFILGVEAKSNSFLYFNLINQLPVFLIGFALFWSERAGLLNYLNWKTDIISFVSFSTIVTLLWKLKPLYAFSIIPFLVALSFFFLYDLFSKIKSLNNPVIVELGRVSFSLYIFHFIFAWNFSKAIFQSLNSLLSANFLLILCYVITVFLTYCLARVTEILIEKRGISWGQQLIEFWEKH